MHKVLLVIQREYLARVKKKSFLIATLLTPLIFPAIMAVFVWIAVEEKENQSLRVIEVVDETEYSTFPRWNFLLHKEFNFMEWKIRAPP